MADKSVNELNLVPLRAMIEVRKNYTPLEQSNIIDPEVSVGALLDAHAKLKRIDPSAAAGGELAGPWYVYKESSADGKSITAEHVQVLTEAKALNRDVTLQELIKVAQAFSGPTLAAGGELVGPWYVLREGANTAETLGEVRIGPGL